MSEKEEAKLEEQKGRGRKGRRKQQNYGVSRGLDFRNVKTVVNVDFPLSVKSYIHRVGRTARGGKSGEALCLVSPNELELLEQVLDFQRTSGATENQIAVEPSLKLLPFNMQDIENFRYRVDDVSRAVTRVAIKEARLKELKNELVNSQKLQSHFEDKPRELDLLKHDKYIKPAQVKPYLAAVPSYLLPSQMSGASNVDYNAIKKKRKNARRNNFVNKRAKKDDPLKSSGYNPNKKAKVSTKQIKLPTTGAKGKFTESRVGFRESTAGRRKWKAKHQTKKDSKKKETKQ